jgi:Sigma-70, region 4
VGKCAAVPSLEDLPPEHRAVAELVLDKGQSYDEIAQTLGMPEERVRAVAQEAAGKLRGEEGEDGGEGPEEPRHADLLLLFSVYVLGIVGGLAYFTVIGLSHH